MAETRTVYVQDAAGGEPRKVTLSPKRKGDAAVPTADAKPTKKAKAEPETPAT